METVHSYAVRHKDGHYVNIRWEPVKGLQKAYRSHDQEGLMTVLHGVHKPQYPDSPDNYYLQPITVTYQEADIDVQEE